VAAVSLAAGDFVLVRPGASVPADGSVVEGRASVEEAILTGESMPRTRTVGDAVLAGSVVRDGALVLAVTAAGAATRLASIERLVERAGSARPRLARIADRVARWFVAALLVVAALTAIAWWQLDPARALAVTFAVLVVSCPCALSLATPAALAAAAGALGRRRVVIARADALESLARVTHVVFDKTGTLTTGRLSLVDTVVADDTSGAQAIALAAALESVSEHPIARAFAEANGSRSEIAVQSPSVVPGHGVEGIIAGRVVRLGTLPFAAALSGARSSQDPVADAHPSATIVTMGDACGIIASFVLADALRPDARALIERLRALHVVPVLLSGDRASTVAAAAAALRIDDARGNALPEEKRSVIGDLQAHGAVVAMVGDGVNDAPSLAQAQVSVSLGTATPLAQWTADVVVLADALLPIADAIAHARRTLAVVRENLGWAFAYNLVAIPAAAFGFVTPLVAALGMSVSSLVVVGNALRLARIRVDPHLAARIVAPPPRGSMRRDAA
jgi:Cu2+-exporting ATPase